MLYRTLPLGIRLRDALAWIGTLALTEGKYSAATTARELVGNLGQTEVTVQIPIDHILCQTADELRRLGQTEAVEHLEILIQELKGGQPRIIAGQMNFTADNLSRLDDQLELLRRVVAPQIAG